MLNHVRPGEVDVLLLPWFCGGGGDGDDSSDDSDDDGCDHDADDSKE